jgi:hypothetical protein
MPKLDLIVLVKWIGYLTLKVHFHIWLGVLLSYFILWAGLFIIFFPNFNRKTARFYHHFLIFMAKLLSRIGLICTHCFRQMLFYTPIFISDFTLVVQAEWPGIKRLFYQFKTIVQVRLSSLLNKFLH